MKSIKKRFLGVVASMIMVLSLFVLPVNVNATTGDGTKDNPYIISNVNDLKLLDQREQYIYAKLANDIDLSQEIPSTDYYLKYFYGELDGNGHQIKNLPSQKCFIYYYYAGDLKNFNLVLNVSTLENGSYTGLVCQQVNLAKEDKYTEKEHKYTHITFSGNVEVGNNNNNESPIVIQADGDTTMESVHINLNYTSSTYNGLFIGYEPAKNSTYTFRNCSVSGEYIGQHIGILFGNGAMSKTSDYGLQHIEGINYEDVTPTSKIVLENLDLTKAKIIGIESQPHLLCGVSYNAKYFDNLEQTLATKTTGYNQLTKATSLEDASFQLNDNNELKITNSNDSIGAFEVISEVYSNVFTSNGISNGTLKHSVSETINVEDGITTYYSSLGKVKFYDGSNGVYGTTGLEGKTKTITVGNETYYTLQPSTNGDVYTFGKEAEVSNTSKLSNVRVLVYDKTGNLINVVQIKEKEEFTKPNLNTTADANVTLENVSLDDGWTWTKPQTKVVVGGQIAFAKKGTELTAVYIEGKAVPTKKITLSLESANLEVGSTMTLNATVDPANTTDQLTWSSNDQTVATVDENGKVTAVGPGKAIITATSGDQSAKCEVTVYKVESKVEVPSLDTSKPVDKVTVAINDKESQKNISATLASIVDNVANGKEVTSVSKETAEKIAEAIDNGQVISTEVQVENMKAENVTTADKALVEKAIDKNANVGQYFDISIVIKAENKELGNITKLDDQLTFTVAIPEELKKENREFYIVRVHDEKAEKLDTVENKDGTLTFKTDKFSTYALVYVDSEEDNTTAPNQPTDKPNTETTTPSVQTPTQETTSQKQTDKVKTDDESKIGLYVMSGAIAVVGAGIILMTKKKKNY